MAKLSARGRTEIETYTTTDGQRRYRGMSDGVVLYQFKYSDGRWSTPTVAKRCASVDDMRARFAKFRSLPRKPIAPSAGNS